MKKEFEAFFNDWLDNLSIEDYNLFMDERIHRMLEKFYEAGYITGHNDGSFEIMAKLVEDM